MDQTYLKVQNIGEEGESRSEVGGGIMRVWMEGVCK